MVADLSSSRADCRLPLQFQSFAVGSLAHARRHDSHDRLLCQLGPRGFRFERHRHTLRLPGREPRRQGFLDPTNVADVPARVIVEQILAQLCAAPSLG